MISVQDTGVGISKEDQSLLFMLFGKISSTTQLNRHGIGLGLNICHQLITNINGKIWVESEVGKGSTFAFTIPLSQQHVSHVPMDNSAAAVDDFVLDIGNSIESPWDLNIS